MGWGYLIHLWVPSIWQSQDSRHNCWMLEKQVLSLFYQVPQFVIPLKRIGGGHFLEEECCFESTGRKGGRCLARGRLKAVTGGNKRKEYSVPTACQLSCLGLWTQPAGKGGSVGIWRTGSLVCRKGRYPGRTRGEEEYCLPKVGTLWVTTRSNGDSVISWQVKWARRSQRFNLRTLLYSENIVGYPREFVLLWFT